MNIAGYLKSSLIDYPDTLASVIYSPECNFSCGYCHNKDLVLSQQDIIDETLIFEHLIKRKRILDGVVITGGEPTLQKNLIPFIKKIKALDFKVKLDTNGYRPQVIKDLLDGQLIDYIAMDIKNSREAYSLTVDKNKLNFNPIEESIDLIKSSQIDYEFRTTLVKEYHDDQAIQGMGNLIRNSKRYILQQYEYSDKQIHNKTFNHFTLEEMGRFKEQIEVQYNVDEVLVRGRF